MDIIHALISLKPNAQWEMDGDDYENITWLDTEQQKPTKAEVLSEVTRLQNKHVNNLYQRNRASEYPDFKEYLDGIVKGDQAQIDKYIADCQAVKNKYPKPID